MAQSLARVYLHIVFSTKNREPFLVQDQVRQGVHAHLASLCGANRSPAIQIGGVADHVHVFCALGRTVAIADLVKEIKRGSTKRLKAQSSELADFAWQDGYGAFSISPSHVPELERYIRNQEKHHRTESFEDEYRRLLAKYEVDYDESYFLG